MSNKDIILAVLYTAHSISGMLFYLNAGDVMLKKIQNYVSEVDKFLKKFDREHRHQLTEAQKKEIRHNKRIQALRDEAPTEQTNQEIWEKF